MMWVLIKVDSFGKLVFADKIISLYIKLVFSDP